MITKTHRIIHLPSSACSLYVFLVLAAYFVQPGEVFFSVDVPAGVLFLQDVFQPLLVERPVVVYFWVQILVRVRLALLPKAASNGRLQVVAVQGSQLGGL